MKLCLISLFAVVQVSVGCNGSPSAERADPSRTVAVAQAAVPAPTSVAAAAVTTERASAAMVATAAGGVQASVSSTRASETKPSTSTSTGLAASALIVKRLVVTTGVKDREPLAPSAALPADGSPIYAFVELANPVGPSENVRVTFERKGAKERVGDVTLPVPGSTPRHRTWAFTRFIRTPGQWDAVLWGENGVELARTSFAVGAS